MATTESNNFVIMLVLLCFLNQAVIAWLGLSMNKTLIFILEQMERDQLAKLKAATKARA